MSLSLALPSASASTSAPPSGPSSRPPSPKRKKRRRERDDDVDASENELVAADERDDDEGDEHDGAGEGEVGGGENAALRMRGEESVADEARRRKWETMALRGQLDAEQGRRFDAFLATVIPKAVVRRINKDLYDQKVSENVQALLGGIAKVFVADLVEAAKDVQAEAGDRGPLRPHHLQRARERLEARGLLGGPSARAPPTGLRPAKRLLRR
ncbi:transcription initiation factor TFIID subunit 11 [Cryptotrichosporon argae]